MKWAWSVLMTLIPVLAACQSVKVAEPKAAVLVATAPQINGEIQRAVAALLAVDAVTLAPDAFINTSVIYIERAHATSLANPLPRVRQPGRPARVQLLLDGSHCVLVHLNTERCPVFR